MENTEYLGEQYKPQWGKCDLNDFSKLKIEDGKIFVKIYQQDGSMQEMIYKNTQENRLLCSWIQIHDRY